MFWARYCSSYVLHFYPDLYCSEDKAGEVFCPDPTSSRVSAQPDRCWTRSTCSSNVSEVNLQHFGVFMCFRLDCWSNMDEVLCVIAQSLNHGSEPNHRTVHSHFLMFMSIFPRNVLLKPGCERPCSTPTGSTLNNPHPGFLS